MPKFGARVQDRSGIVVAELAVTVYEAGTSTLATIYSDHAMSEVVPDSVLTTDANGGFSFFAPSGEYKYTFEKNGTITEEDFVVVAAGTHDDLSGLTTGDPHEQYDRTAVFDARRYASVQEAVEAAEAAGAGTVLVQEDADLTSSLTISGSNIVLESRNRATLTAAASIAQILNITGATRVRIRGLVFAGEGSVTSQVIAIGGASSDVTVEDCALDCGGASAGISLGSVTGAVVKRCEVHDVLNAIRMTGASGSRIAIEDNDLYDWSERGVWGNGSASVRFNDVRISRNHIHSHDTAGSTRRPIHFGGDETNPNLRLSIVDNRIVGNGSDFASGGTADQIAVGGTEGFIIRGNISVDGGDNGIVASQEAARGVIAGNIVERCHNAGIVVGSSASVYTRDITVSENNCSNNGQSAGMAEFKAGIRVASATDVVLGNNFCGDDQGVATQEYGILVEGSTRVRVGINKFDGNKTAGLRDEGGNTDLEIATLRTAIFPAYASPVAGATAWSSPARSGQNSHGQVSIPAPFNGFARNLQVVMATAPGNGESLIVTLNKSATGQSLTATISGTNTTASDETHAPTFSEGELLSFSFVASNNGAYAGAHCRVACELVELAD